MPTSRQDHPLEPFVPAGARVLVLGSFPSPKSRARGLYYGNPQNRFWRVLAALAGAEAPSDVAGCYALAGRLGVALWDVIGSCDITGASDASIANVVPNDIAALVAGTSIRAVATTGSKSAALYRRYDAGVGLPHIALPSTSPANARMRLEDLVAAYSVLKPYLDL